MGRRAFAKGERINLMKNDNRFGVKNGMFWTTIHVDKQKLQVRLDAEKGRRQKPYPLPPSFILTLIMPMPLPSINPKG